MLSGGLDCNMSAVCLGMAVSELSQGRNIIYKIMWLMEKGRERKVTATAEDSGEQSLTF